MKLVGEITYAIGHFSLKRASYILNGTIALVLYAIFFRRKRRLWILGTGNGLFDNNVKAFYNFCSSQNLDIEYKFITTKMKLDTPVPKLRKGSVHAYISVFMAEVLVNDSGNSDLAPGFIKFARGLKVNLNHGQEGFKKLKKDYYKEIIADINCSVSDFESNIKIDCCGANPDTVYVTGQARYDNISENPLSRGDILLFFTWRDGMQYKSSEEILKSKYYESIQEIITSPVISNILQEYNQKMYFRLHHMLPPIDLSIKNEYIIPITDEDNFTEIINRCSVLITDYSSICWDYIYNGRDVIFYPFDYEDYSVYPGLYIDLDANIGLNVAKCIESLEDKIRTVLDSSTKNRNTSLSSHYFKYHDKNNCKRIYELIIDKLGIECTY